MKNLQKILLFFVIVTLINCSRNNEWYNPEPFPFQDEETGKWGFVDISGKVIIEPKFESRPGYFKEGVALIEKATGYDYINLNGDTLGYNFQTATPFEEGMALVTIEDGNRCFIKNDFSDAFCINNLKQEVITCGLFSEGLAKFQSENNKWGYLNTSGEVVIEPVYTKALNFKEGYAFVELRDINTDKVDKLFIDINGNIKIRLDKNIREVRSFSEGLAAVKDSSGWGFIDTRGKIIITPDRNWKTVTNFNNGCAAFYEYGQWGAINKKGKRILGSLYDAPPIFFSGLSVLEEDDGMGFVNKKGINKIEAKYEEIAYPFYKGKAVVKDGKYYIFVSKSGRIASKPELFDIDRSYIDNVLQSILGYSPEESVVNYSYYRKIILDGKYSVKGLYPVNQKTAMTTKCYHFINNDLNELVRIEYLDDGEAGEEDPFFGCSKVAFEYNDSTEKRIFLDKYGRKTMSDDEVYSEMILLNNSKQRIAKLNLDYDSDPVENKYGVARYSWELDKYGSRVKETLYDTDNEIIIIGNIYFRKYTWDRRGNLTDMQFLNEEGQLTENNEGIAIQKWEYDKNNNQTKVEFYNKDSKLQDNSSGIAISSYQYDNIGRMIRIDFYDSENKKTAFAGYKVATILREYDDENDEINDTYLDIDGNEISL
jgi:hypothetical protein